jgi:hypothetical protein
MSESANDQCQLVKEIDSVFDLKVENCFTDHQ